MISSSSNSVSKIVRNSPYTCALSVGVRFPSRACHCRTVVGVIEASEMEPRPRICPSRIDS